MDFSLKPETTAAAIAALRTAIAELLTRQHGHGHWSSKVSGKEVLYALGTSRVFVAREGTEILATLRLATKKPWTIDTSYFAARRRLGIAPTDLKARWKSGATDFCLPCERHWRENETT